MTTQSHRWSFRPLFDPLHPPSAGEMAGFEIAAVDLDDVAGYEFEIK